MANENSGGSTYAARRANTDFLSIADVISYKESLMNASVLYTPIIEKGVASSQVEAACQMISKKADDCDDLIETICTTLQETESNRYYLSEEAQKHMNAITEAQDDMIKLKEKLIELNESNIENTVNEYNTALKKLKNGARLKILQAKADEINAVVQSQDKHGKVDGVQICKDPNGTSRSYTISAGCYGSCPYYNHEGKNLNYYTYDDWQYSTDKYGNTTCTLNEYEWHYINYWKIIKPGSFWDFLNISDDDVETLEGKVIAVLGKEKLPYDKSKIIEY